MTMTRRTFVAGSLALSAAGFARIPAALGQAKPKLVVIGGGPAGATIAKYVARDSQGAIDVTLVEPLKQYETCFFSNLYLGGFRDLPTILHSYDRLAANYGVKIQPQMALGVDRDKREVKLADGTVLPYDRLVVTPGVSLKYASVPGYSEAAAEKMPHAWLPGAQTQQLKSDDRCVPDGGLVVMLRPPNPYRCPPGPYERASMMAHVFASTGRRPARSSSSMPRRDFPSRACSQPAWEKHYPGMIEWLPPTIHGGVKIRRCRPRTPS